MGRGADLAGVGAIPNIYILGLVMLELLGVVSMLFYCDRSVCFHIVIAFTGETENIFNEIKVKASLGGSVSQVGCPDNLRY